MLLLLAVLGAALVAPVRSHTIFQQIGINGQMAERHNYMRLPNYDGPVTDVTTAAMACNGDPNPLTHFSPNVATLAAGSEVTLKWYHTLNSENTPSNPAIDSSHKGPIMVYMAKVDSATGPIPSDGWFKIYEDGLVNGEWAIDRMNANNGAITVKIPSCLPVGDYLLRGEIIALHAAGSYPGAQLYMECAQLRVTSGGTTLPSSTVSFPGAYTPNDVTFQLYWPVPTSYDIPGPRPFVC
ncbi:glycoside hydrolase family 61 protein [Ascodesmis nigricans]|uniref:AA9 family lytic polysaccharide monooxygenase n=1 Tax=Ascodesmis nigricans TaxID=341454 RepID=A0A4V3SHI6_9PEZI|nr:glycoside hydrolase family 61 protein [Ascodesmis nigricans]